MSAKSQFLLYNGLPTLLAKMHDTYPVMVPTRVGSQDALPPITTENYIFSGFDF